jgi:hypothetical protein
MLHVMGMIRDGDSSTMLDLYILSVEYVLKY